MVQLTLLARGSSTRCQELKRRQGKRRRTKTSRLSASRRARKEEITVLSVCSAMSTKHRTPSFPHLPPGEQGWASQARTQDPQVWSHELTPPSSSSTAHSPSNRNPPPSAASWCASPLPVPPPPSVPPTPPPPSPPPSLPCASQEGREVGSEVAEEGCGGGVVSSIGSAYPGTGGSCRPLPFPFAPFCGGRMKVVTRLCILHSTGERARARERERERERERPERGEREREREREREERKTERENVTTLTPTLAK
jgi:hypothetical protein